MVTTKIDQNLIRWSIGQGQQSGQKMKEIQKVVQMLSREQESVAGGGGGGGGGGVRTGTKTQSHPRYTRVTY